MAEANFQEFVTGSDSSRTVRFAKLVNIAGAISSLALLAGLAVWGYQLAMRDVSQVPVIMALDTPMRVAPEDPGGRIAAHMGLSVTRVAADGIAGQVPDTITLAPRPLDVVNGDTAGIGAAAPPEGGHARALALAEALTANIQPLSSDGAAAGPGADGAAAEPGVPPENPLFPAEEPATTTDARGMVVRSPRPQPRPERVAATPGQGGAAAVTEIEPAALVAGAPLAQIGAFDAPDLARREWDRVAPRSAALFEGKSRVIQPATSGGRTFYRLRIAGFVTEAESRRFCAAIENSDLRCIPVVHK